MNPGVAYCCSGQVNTLPIVAWQNNLLCETFEKPFPFVFFLWAGGFGHIGFHFNIKIVADINLSFDKDPDQGRT